MKNIFENAYFGKVYKTRDGRKAIFLYSTEKKLFKEYLLCYTLFIEDETDFYHYDTDGLNFSGGYAELEDGTIEYWGTDIVSEWEEPINEEKLEELAEAYSLSIDNFPNKWFTKVHIKTLVECAYMVGYETAKKGE